MSSLCRSPEPGPSRPPARHHSVTALEASTSRSTIARARAVLARAALRDCRLCAHDCGIDRLSGATGICRAGPEARFFSAQLEAGDESELVPTFAIAVSGCDLRCDFCVTRAESWNARAGQPLRTGELAQRARAALDRGARTIMILGGEPTIHLADVLQLVAELPDRARLVWKTNAHASAQARELLDGIFDVWLPDYKFGNDACAESLARIRSYNSIVRENILWAGRRADLIVRHLLMPGHVECCWAPIAGWLAAETPGVKVSLRDGFWPALHSAHAELRRVASAGERRRALALAHDLNLNLVA